MSSSSSNHDYSSSDDEMLFDERNQEVVMFFQCAFNAFNYYLFMVKAYRLIINFETQNKVYKEPFGYMDRMPKAKISYLNS